MLRSHVVLVLAVLLLSPGFARAQATPEELADANRAAMDLYNNLDIETAKKQLEQAARAAEKNGVKGPALARTYANLGVICVGGLSDNSAGLDAFVKALQQDPTVEPDPLVSTPEIQNVYQLAKRKAGVSGKPGSGSTKPGSGGSTEKPTPRPASGPVEGNLQHIPVAEQLSQTGVPVYVEAGGLQVTKMQVFYRSLGMPKPKSADMEPMGSGFGFVIPCKDVFEPNVEYFVVAYGAGDQQIGNAGTPQNPVSVPIVAERTQPPPALPGQQPPAQCKAAEECPPGMPGCKKGNPGDTCNTDADCGEGLICADNFCAFGDKQDGGGDEARGDSPRVFFDLGVAIGAAYVGANMAADSPPPASVVVPGEKEMSLKRAKEGGWDCQAVTKADGTIELTDCTVAVQQSGFASNVALAFAAGVFFTPRLYGAATGRIQLGHGDGTLAGLLIGGRLGYMLTAPAADGFNASVFVGGGAGQIQVQPPAQEAGANGPYVASGLGAGQIGASLGYRFSRNFGLQFTPQANFMLPTFLFDLDLGGGVQIAF